MGAPVSDAPKPVAVIMGSQSDWMVMRRAAETLEGLGVGYDARIVSAHRTPDRLVAFAKGARTEGFKVIIAGAGGAAHLPGMTAAFTTLPVFGVPVPTKTLLGQDSLLSIVQMPAGVPVGTLAIGDAAPDFKLPGVNVLVKGTNTGTAYSATPTPTVSAPLANLGAGTSATFRFRVTIN